MSWRSFCSQTSRCGRMFQTVYAVFKQDLHIGVPHTPPCPQKFTKTSFNTLVTYPEEMGTTLRRWLCKDMCRRQSGTWPSKTLLDRRNQRTQWPINNLCISVCTGQAEVELHHNQGHKGSALTHRTTTTTYLILPTRTMQSFKYHLLTYKSFC